VTRLSWLAFVGLTACNTDGARRVAPPPASTPLATASVVTVPVPAATPSAAPLASAAPAPDGGAGDRRRDGPPDCRFERPAAWTSGRLSWLGSCRAGLAQGSGVLVRDLEADLGLEPQRFFGSLQNGYLSVGVLEVPGGFRAGTWADGDLAAPLADDLAQRNVVIDAFEVAATAATAVSQSFAEKGDAKASRLYADQARRLRDQID